ncbi:glycoside hydrolase family 43 protein [Sphingomonas sp. GM_Shp_2]|uniref:glycoside hydrolase family 43 protein n=1 Tax=Sphingomonas sp. GM_Shp_2 TaxID=2937380 RepID=UPI00226A3CF0
MRLFIHPTAVVAVALATTLLRAPDPLAARDTRQLAIVDKAGLTKPPADPGKRSAYLMSYFTDEDHSLHLATSRDGYRFTDVNGGKAVLSGRKIAEQKGIRDPHIMRGPDGAFYLSMTDLHIFAKREGLRATDWERPEEEYGWGNNRNMIFMKSHDLLHWTLARVTTADLFTEYRNIGNSWAPETIYDPQQRKLMVYYTTRDGNGPNYLVYSYADPDFTTLTAVPRKLFSYPDPKVNVIDADITKVGNRYHMFYVAHTAPGNIRHAVSSRINTGWSYEPGKVDHEQHASEAPTLWRRYNTNTYVLMYDVFGIKPNNMGFAETKDFVTFKPLGRFNDAGSPMKATNFTRPKHGAVVAITEREAERLEHFFQ